MTFWKILAMVSVCLLVVVAPLGAMAYLHRRRGGRWFAFMTGALTFPLFALGLEQAFHALVLKSPLGPAVQGNVWLYGLYGGLAAGVFEETGRLAAFRLVLRERREPVSALCYGLGHGGMEAFLLAGLSMAANLVLGLVYAGGGVLPPELSPAVEAVVNTPAGMFLWSGFERLAAMTLHVSLSVLVFAAVQTRKWRLYPAAVLAHAGVNFIAVVSNAYLPTAATEALVMAFALLAAAVAAKIYKNLPKTAETP